MTVTPSPRLFALCNCGSLHGPNLDRRRFLVGGAATLAFGVAASPGFVAEAVAQTKPHRIDVHHHIVLPAWLDALKSMKKDTPPVTNWSVQKTLDDMEAGGVATAMTSPTTPQLQGLDAPAAARVAKESDEWAKKLEADHPGHFGTWAMLPLPHVDESLKAIEYAFDTLKVDGVGIMTRYGDKWLGYQEFEPVWQELNRRKAIVYTHPTGANCCVNLVRDVDEAYIEFGTDTTRSIFTIIFSGFAEKYPDINWIWSHGGGSITAFYERFTVQALMRPPYKGKFTRDQVEKQIRRFYYDTAAISERCHAICARKNGAGLANRLRNGLPLSPGGGIHQTARRVLQGRGSGRSRARERTAAGAALEDSLSAVARSSSGAASSII